MSSVFIATKSLPEAHNPDDIYSVATSFDYTVTGGGDGQLIAWEHNRADGPHKIVLKTIKHGWQHLSIDKEGLWLVGASFNGSVSLFDLKKLKEVEVPELNQKADCWNVAVDKAGNNLALATVGGKIELWSLPSEDPSTCVHKHTILPTSGIPKTLEFSHDGDHLAIGYHTGSAYVFSVESRRLVYSFMHSKPLRSVKFSPLGTFLAVAGDGETISLYSMNSGEQIANLSGHEGWIFDIAWSQQGDLLLSCGYDQKAKVWSIETFTCVNTQIVEVPLTACSWLEKGSGTTVIGGVNKGYVLTGFDTTVRWFREASGS